MRLCSVRLILLICLAGCSCFTHGPESKIPGLGAVQNFAVIEEGKLYRGARPSRAAIAQLRDQLHIKSIVNLDEVHDDCEALVGLRYFYLPSNTRARDKNAPQILQFLKIATDGSNQPIFVHCNRGADRTGEFVAAYRVVIQNRSLVQVYKEMDEHLFCAWQFYPLKSHIRHLHAHRADVLQSLQSLATPTLRDCPTP